MKVGEKMIYIPLFKGRRLEHQVIESKNECFSEQIIPLVEIIKDHFCQTEFATDPTSGEYLKKPAKTRMQRYRIAPTDDDRNTLEYYQGLLNGKKAFIDYFRFSPDVYGRSLNYKAVDLSVMLSQNEKKYFERLLELSKFETLVPVLSIKEKFFPKSCTTADIINRLQSGNAQVAIRLDEAAYATLASSVAPLLRQGDYLMYDLGEQKMSSKEIELDEYNALETLATKLILNSPRRRKVNNGDYQNRQYTSLIDNSARDIGLMYESIRGYGDYCGMRDSLPGKQAGGRGCALALFYQYSSNQFMAYVNSNSDEGFSGYSRLIPQIIADANTLDSDGPSDEIIEIKELSKKGKCGVWTTWHGFNMSRYLTQVYKNI